MTVHYYEIVNPSDKVTIACDDDMIAAVAVLMLGQGKFGLRRDDDKVVLPVFLLGGAENWLEHKCGVKVDALPAWIREHAPQLATCLESVFYGSPKQMHALDEALKEMSESERLPARARYNDRMRSSLNDIGAYALAMAARLRENNATNTNEAAHG